MSSRLKLPSFLSRYGFRHALSVVCAVLVAMIYNQSEASAHTGFAVLAAFLASQSSRGAPARQSIIVSFVIFFLFLGFMVVMPSYPLISKVGLQEAMIGAVLGILASLICPVPWESELGKGLLPMLEAMREFLHVLRTSNMSALTMQKHQIEALLVSHRQTYPEWVYEKGFNPGLRAGYRYFLVNMEGIIEILFSLHYVMNQYGKEEVFARLHDKIGQVIDGNVVLLDHLSRFFARQPLVETAVDFTTDIEQLELALQETVPNALELLDISSAYVAVTAVCRDLKDVRGILLDLVKALP